MTVSQTTGFPRRRPKRRSDNVIKATPMRGRGPLVQMGTVGLAVLCVMAGFFGAWSVPAHAEPAVTSFTLDNGMDVVVIEDNRAPVVTHMVWYRVGAADEPPGRSGIAHFLEHLMFKGTKELSSGEFQRVIAANGGQDNAFTSLDYTAYFQRIAADRLEMVMRMEADRMVNLQLSVSDVETEREVILEERNQRTDNSPEALFAEQMMAALYLNHPYGVPTIGWRHEMQTLNLDDALAFYDRYYAPDNAILVVAGDVTPDRVLELAKVHYGPLEPSGNPPDPRPQEPPQLAPRRMQDSDPRVAQSYVTRSYLVPAYNPEEPKTAAALTILAQILGSGTASRFSEALQLEQKIAIGTGALYSARSRDVTNFAIYGVPAPGHTLEAVEDALDAELARMAADGPTDAELARVKRLVRAGLVFAQDSQSSLAQLYGAMLALGFSVEDIRNWPGVIETITPEDVRRAAADMLRLERSVTGWMMSEPAGE